jgi:hypothetical protein
MLRLNTHLRVRQHVRHGRLRLLIRLAYGSFPHAFACIREWSSNVLSLWELSSVLYGVHLC